MALWVCLWGKMIYAITQWLRKLMYASLSPYSFIYPRPCVFSSSLRIVVAQSFVISFFPALSSVVGKRSLSFRHQLNLVMLHLHCYLCCSSCFIHCLDVPISESDICQKVSQSCDFYHIIQLSCTSSSFPWNRHILVKFMFVLVRPWCFCDLDFLKVG